MGTKQLRFMGNYLEGHFDILILTTEPAPSGLSIVATSADFGRKWPNNFA